MSVTCPPRVASSAGISIAESRDQEVCLQLSNCEQTANSWYTPAGDLLVLSACPQSPHSRPQGDPGCQKPGTTWDPWQKPPSCSTLRKPTTLSRRPARSRMLHRRSALPLDERSAGSMPDLFRVDTNALRLNSGRRPVCSATPPCWHDAVSPQEHRRWTSVSSSAKASRTSLKPCLRSNPADPDAYKSVDATDQSASPVTVGCRSGDGRIRTSPHLAEGDSSESRCASDQWRQGSRGTELVDEAFSLDVVPGVRERRIEVIEEMALGAQIHQHPRSRQ